MSMDGVGRTFRQQAIIDRLAVVVNSIDGRVQPSLADNGKIEEIARILMRGSHRPER